MSVQNHVTASKNFNVRILAPTANGTESLRGQVSWSSNTLPLHCFLVQRDTILGHNLQYVKMKVQGGLQNGAALGHVQALWEVLLTSLYEWSLAGQQLHQQIVPGYAQQVSFSRFRGTRVKSSLRNCCHDILYF